MPFKGNIKRLSKKFWAGQRLLILGGTGFIGSGLVSVLESLGCRNYKVVTRNKRIKGPRYIYSDLSQPQDVRAIRRHIRQAGYIFIFSGNFPQASGIDISFTSFLKNIAMVENLMSEISDKTKKIILASSTDVYGHPETSSVDESCCVNPANYYALSKYIQEKIIEYKLKHNAGKYLILRFTSIYGRNEPAIKFLPTLLNSIVRNEAFTVYGSTRQLRDILNVEDAAVLSLYLAQRGASGIFNVSTGQGVTIKELLGLAERISGKTIPLQYKERIKPERNLTFDNNKLLRFIRGFEFKPLREGLQEQYQSLCREGKPIL